MVGSWDPPACCILDPAFLILLVACPCVHGQVCEVLPVDRLGQLYSVLELLVRFFFLKKTRNGVQLTMNRSSTVHY